MIAGSAALAGLLLAELQGSRGQAFFLSRYASGIRFAVDSGPSPAIRFPSDGPYDQRLGYDRLPDLIPALETRGMVVDSQARISTRLASTVDAGLFELYREKPVAGLHLLDRHGRTIARFSYPQRIYDDFDSIPPILVRTLLHVENRELLDERRAFRNPAVEWDRLARSVFQFVRRGRGGSGSVSGASTLATQVEKFRHSPGGLTTSPREKLRQMATASLRAYLDDEHTIGTRRRLVLDYLNSVPLSAIQPHGEVNGIGDGLWAWYGIDFGDANRQLWALDSAGARGDPASVATFRAALSLILAQRRPSYYLAQTAGREALIAMTDRYLELLANARVIDGALESAARGQQPQLLRSAPPPPPYPFVERKATTALRTYLLTLFEEQQTYRLDRLDLTVRSTIDSEVQDAVTRELVLLADSAHVRAAGLDAPRMLADADPSRVVYSFVLYERTADGNVVRVQTDNYNAPFDLNQAARLELGSTAKLRTLATYLEVVEQLHASLGALPEAERARVREQFPDPLTAWAVGQFERGSATDLPSMLRAAMERQYSASPAQRFFTGGGTHVFANFDHTYDNSVVTVREAFQHSVNLAFIRIMRDITAYYTYRVPGSAARALADPMALERQELLGRFADYEGSRFVRRFFARYRGKDRSQVFDLLVMGRRLSPQRLAWVFRVVDPAGSVEQFATFVSTYSPQSTIAPGAVERWFASAEPAGVPWSDRGYLASIHPLELWVASYLLDRPGASLSETVAASSDERREVYRWLFSTRRRNAQDQRIRILLEVEAFLEIQRSWQRLGYPFPNLVPSLGTAIGSSGDRPGALAELVGIFLNDGVRYPVVRITEMRFGEGTPFETILRRRAATGERVVSPEIAAVVRQSLVDVVEAGTARRANGAVRDPNGNLVTIGGKTGTGNNVYKVFGPGGRLVESRTVSRTAVFVFVVGDRFFGVISAYVPGPDAAAYTFTSALATALFHRLGPVIEPLLVDPASGEPPTDPRATLAAKP